MTTLESRAPAGNWVMSQRWQQLLFTHWRVVPSEIQAMLPQGVTVDEFDGSAWVGAVAFRMDDIQWRSTGGLPQLLRLLTKLIDLIPGGPDLHRFPELNLRTYVQGPEGPGVAFLSIDAPSRYNVFMAKKIFGLPFHYASVDLSETAEGARFSAERGGGGGASFRVEYAGTGSAVTPEEGSLERFLVERYAQYADGPLGKLMYAELAHDPWEVQAARAEITSNTVLDAAGIVPQSEPEFHYVREMGAWFFRPRLIDSS